MLAALAVASSVLLVAAASAPASATDSAAPAAPVTTAPAASVPADVFSRLADPETVPYAITGKGFVTDASHPMHPGDFRKYDVTARLSVNPELGEAALDLTLTEKDESSTDHYYVRRGRVFQVNEKGEETATSAYGDVSAATLAALHPSLVASAMLERRDAVRGAGPGHLLFAWNDEMWTVDLDVASGRISRLERQTFNGVFGDVLEEVRYDAWPDGASLAPGRVVVTSRGREVLHLDFAPIERGIALTAFPEGNRQRDRSMAVASSDVALQEVAPHVFTIDLAQANTRVTVAEFADHLMVIEGAYSSRLCDRIADVLRARFHKPVRYFAFSHLHGQYVGGVRSWVEEGATVLVPPTTAPLIDEIVKSPATLRPDAFAKSPKPLHVETIADRRRLEDGTNAVDVINVESGHTDEYFLFYFPKQKVLMTGDLLFFVPGKPLSGRSKLLCHTVAKLGLDVTTYYATWPLTGYSTKNVVTAEEMKAACAEAK
ncbi:MAG: hypothetical protein U0167_17495 [bacterium]